MEAIVKVEICCYKNKELLSVTLKRAVMFDASKIGDSIIGIHNNTFANGNMNIFCKAKLTFIPSEQGLCNCIDMKYFAEINGVKFEIPEHVYNNYLNSRTIEINGRNYKIMDKDTKSIRLCTSYSTGTELTKK